MANKRPKKVVPLSSKSRTRQSQTAAPDKSQGSGKTLQPIIGIDFGHSHFAAAVIKNGRPVMIPSSGAEVLSPAVPHFTESEEWIVGKAALDQISSDPTNTVYGITKLIGAPFASEECQSFAKTVPFKIVEMNTGECGFRIRGQNFGLVQLLSEVFKKVKARAEKSVGLRVDAAVIAVPASLTFRARESIVRAAALAGLTVSRTILSIVSAVVGHCFQTGLQGNVLALSLADGACEACVVVVDEGVYEVKAVDAQGGLASCSTVLKDTGLLPGDIAHIILQGGSSNLPAALEDLGAMLGKRIEGPVASGENVAIGAAVQGAVMYGGIIDVLPLPVLSASLGLEMSGGLFVPVLSRNTHFPTAGTLTVATATDHQSSAFLHVLQGTGEKVEENETIGYLELTNLAPGTRGTARIKVRFDVDADGTLIVSASPLGSKKEKFTRITSLPDLSNEEIRRLAKGAPVVKA